MTTAKRNLSASELRPLMSTQRAIIEIAGMLAAATAIVWFAAMVL